MYRFYIIFPHVPSPHRAHSTWHFFLFHFLDKMLSTAAAASGPQKSLCLYVPLFMYLLLCISLISNTKQASQPASHHSLVRVSLSAALVFGDPISRSVPRDRDTTGDEDKATSIICIAQLLYYCRCNQFRLPPEAVLCCTELCI